MEKASGKPLQPRVCFLASLCVFFWAFIFYFQFRVLSGSGSTSNPAQQSFSLFSISINPRQRQEIATDRTLPGRPKSKPSAGPSVLPKTFFPFTDALKTLENKSDPCGGRYIYVHDLPPRFNDDMLRECRKLSLWTNMCKFTSNAGLGPPLENTEGVFSDTGWHATNQFAVDVIFNNRMKRYECLTNDSSVAAAIFVPFYAGFDISRYLWGYNTSVRDAASLDLVDWLMKRPEWSVMGGRDHFLVAGRITWDFRRLTDLDSDWGNKLLFLPAAKNMSMLVVESSPWNSNDFAIPYPTYFHPANDADVFAWQDRMRKLKRKHLFSFAGAPRPGSSKSIRGQIIEQCKNSKVCKLLECDLGESKCHSPSTIMQMFQSSLFCLQPQGDSYTRRSAFDSILAGCIPVFFHPGSAYVQYTWHLPRNFSTYSVFIPEDDIRKRNVSIEERLKQIHPDVVKVMREQVIGLIPRVIYADPRSKLETLNDAFDVAVQAMIDKVMKLRRDIIDETEDKDFIEENSWKYALLEGQRRVGTHEWDPFFSKPKDANVVSNSSSAEAAKNSWKIEQRDQS
ncbi:xyloglucan galactosyltransferase KATAMARI1 homolog isoform X2 [Curcuma longa]|uniref:xyloglucan galactosyltransferase KATAMARI1 homolog isoform X2 n=1 Tax=Curcuma longa TaxID=136217 RepID=UPI003D9E816B